MQLSQEQLAQLRLIRTEKIGPALFYTLIAKYGSASYALEALPKISDKIQRLSPLKICTIEQVHAEIAKVQEYGAQFIFFNQKNYPSLLKQIADAPPVLTAKGNIDLLNKPILGIVGARNASISGKLMAQKFTEILSQKKFIIASGLARGIDTSAHQASLNHGTIAVVAGGINVIYPSENAALHRLVEDKGLIICESAFGTMPQANLFPRRNRLISGISQGILVIEAALKSGSLLTARFALEQNREVFAIPGSPLDPRAQGCNKLIQNNNAYLVQCVDDIIDALGRTQQHAFEFYPTPQPTLGMQAREDHHMHYTTHQIEQEILKNLSDVPICVDDLIRQCSVSGSEILMTLVELELADKIIRHPGNKISLNFLP